jgi:hypothetical protein
MLFSKYSTFFYVYILIYYHYHSYKTDSSHAKDFRKACGAMSVYYDEKSGQLSVIVDQDAGIKRANLLIEQHLKNVRQKINLLRRTQEIAQQIEVFYLI